ncbi:tetratricopeptide repeat protein [Bradyrhizobium erythrophlei]|uniref:tetratricopeptide repeat protein n=1 Tax=Bradyrhizobium erythrophlei TaxID=1437360 RepID=UPI0035EB4A60
MVDLIQLRIAPAISTSVDASPITILTAELGMAPVPTIKLALSNSTSVLSITDGDWRAGGYLAGLQEVIDTELRWATDNKPQLVEAAQQSLKPLIPLMVSDAFTIPKDLTNTSTKEERTRFYHHEYQSKLLVGLAEFLIGCARERNERHVAVIDRAPALFNSTKNLVKLLVRLENGASLFRFIVIDYEQCLYSPDANELYFDRYSPHELAPIFSRDIALEKQRQIFEASGGNPLIAEALSKCEAAGLPVGYLDPIAIVDLYLASLTGGERRSLLKPYIESNRTTPDLIAQRNYAVFEHATADHLHEQLHRGCLDRYLAGEAPLVILRAPSARDKYKRQELLAEPSEILQSIGLYDLWFSYSGRFLPTRRSAPWIGRLCEAIAYDPYYGEYQNDLGNLLSKVPSCEAEALEASARAIELCPPYYEAHLNRATLRARMGNAAGALSDLDRALTIKPNEWRAHFGKGNILMGQNKVKAALQSYLSASEINSQSADLQSNLGLAYSELGNGSESIAYYRRALDLNPWHALMHNNPATEYFKAGERDRSLHHATAAAEIGRDPDYGPTLEHIQMSVQADLGPQRRRQPASYPSP